MIKQSFPIPNELRILQLFRLPTLTASPKSYGTSFFRAIHFFSQKLVDATSPLALQYFPEDWDYQQPILALVSCFEYRF